MPPRHGKSYLTSHFFPAWFLGICPQLRVALTSYEADFAASWGRKARSVLEEFGPTLFGVRPDQKLSSGIRWDLEGHPGGLVTAGVGGPLTGRGADLLIVDDPIKNAEEAFSATLRQKIFDWWLSTAFTRLEPGGRAVVIQTRWHRDDLAGRLLADPEGGWQHLNLPAVAEEHDQLGRSPGEALWPQRWPLEALERIRRSQDVYWWNSLYQQRPSHHEQSEWPDSYWERIWAQGWPNPQDCSERVVALDPSKGTTGHSDYQAIVYTSVHNGKLWVEAELQREPITELCQRLIAMARRTSALAVGIESVSFQELLLPEVQRLAVAGGGAPLPIYAVENTVAKEVRIRRLGPYLAQGLVQVKDTPGGRLLVDQLKDFPLGDHDDGPDALEMCLRLILERGGPSPEDGLLGAMEAGLE